MMSGVSPRQGGERGFLFQILHFLCRKALASKQESAGLFDFVAMEVELPRTVPPKMGFDFDGVSERVGAAEVIFFNGEGAGLLSAEQGTIFHLGSEGGVDRVKPLGKLDVESDAGPVGEFPPLVGAEDGVGFGDGGAGVEEFDFSLYRANDQFGLGKRFREVRDLGRKALLRFLPEGGGGGQKEGGEALGGPVRGSSAGVAFGQRDEFINPAQAEETLRLLDAMAPEEVEIF